MVLESGRFAWRSLIGVVLSRGRRPSRDLTYLAEIVKLGSKVNVLRLSSVRESLRHRRRLLHFSSAFEAELYEVDFV
jgi:hypothetical protein